MLLAASDRAHQEQVKTSEIRFLRLEVFAQSTLVIAGRDLDLAISCNALATMSPLCGVHIHDSSIDVEVLVDRDQSLSPACVEC